MTSTPSLRLLHRLCRTGPALDRHEFLAERARRHRLIPLVERFCRELVAAEIADAPAVLNVLLDSIVIRNHRELTAFVHHSLAAAYRQVGEYRQAAVHQQCAGKGPFVANDDSPSLLSHADLFSAWGQDALVAGEFSLARDYFWRALGCEQNDGNMAGAAADWGHLGLLECMAGSPRDGLRYLWKALSVHRGLVDVAGQIHDVMNLSVAYERAGRMRLSLALIRHAQALLEGRDLPITRFKAEALSKRARHLQLLRQTLPIWN